MIIDIIVGARPNFMKAAALFAVLHKFPKIKLRLIHTGQHYDFNMSSVFLKELHLPKPLRNLEVGSGTHAVQTAEIMKKYENWVQNNSPDLCLVVGDVNSTVACAMVCAKKNVPVGHIEAGLRSFDRTMPEEINRILTDSVSSLFFTTEFSAVKNLQKEGHSRSKIYLVGNTMIDTLLRMKSSAMSMKMHHKFGLPHKGYAYLTLHRPSNVDNLKVLEKVCENIIWLSKRMPIIFPVHPRTQKRILGSSMAKKMKLTERIHLTPPLGYLESLSILLNSKVVITDSGGIQEETSALQIPCLTLRENTERPVTVELGTNTLIKNNWNLFRSCIKKIRGGTYRKGHRKIPFWDGKTSERILRICQKL